MRVDEIKSQPVERRKYRFRAWHKHDHKIYPVSWFGRGGFMLEDGPETKTSLQHDVVLMQYSGLKDIKGRDIYESDIVTTQTTAKKLIILNDGAFRIATAAYPTNLTDILNQEAIATQRVTVVGTIYDQDI